MTKLPLEGIRVADFTQVLQGPYATMLLAQMGAEVIKIETVSRGTEDRVTAHFASRNVSKKSITLNLKDPKGAEVAKKLVKISHMAIENFATGVMERFGLGYDDLRKVKPDIIMLSSQALGRTGPMKDALGYWAEVANFSGQSNLAGYRDSGPALVGGLWADHLAGMLVVFAALAALHHTRKTGEGQYIQISMVENVIAAMPAQILDFSVNGRDLGQQENRDVTMAPHNAYRCQGFDKWVAIAVTNEEEWRAFCQTTGHPEWAQDPRFADPLSRWNNQEELDKLVTQWTLERTDYEAMHILQKAGVPAGPTLNAAGVVDDPHLNDRGFFFPLGEREGNPYTHMGHPWRSSAVPEPFYKPVPELGEHNEYVLGELLGMSEAEIAALVEDKVLV